MIRDAMPYKVVIDRVLWAMMSVLDFRLGYEITDVLTRYYISADDLEINADGTIDSCSDIEVWYELWNGDVDGYISLRADWSPTRMVDEIAEEIQFAYDDNNIPLGDDDN